MGKISDSFKREIGKNTGKTVSNLLFGNKHATPVKLIRETKNELLREKHKTELETKEKERLGKLNNESIQQSIRIAQIPIPKEKNEFVDILNELYINIDSFGWKSVLNGGDSSETENKISNKTSDALSKKYKQILKAFKVKHPETSEIEIFEGYKKKIFYKKIKGKFGSVILLLLLFLVCMLGLAIAS